VAFAGGPLVRNVPFAPTAVVARVRGGLVRLGTPPLTSVRTRLADGTWDVQARGPRSRVRLTGEADGAHMLLPHPEPANGTLDRRAEHWLDGRVEAVVEGRRGGRWRTLGAGASPLAGLERGRPRAGSLRASPAAEEARA
jgi:tocopherol cyclase